MKKQKTIKYSELKKRLRLDTDKNFDDRLANFSHYLQTKSNGVAHYFQKDAVKYLSKLNQELAVYQEPEVQLSLPIKWDVPFPPQMDPKFNFIDLFAGIGGFRIAFQKLGGKCVFSSEWNKYAQKTYEANFGEVPFGDITKIGASEIPEHDILLGGFPCQPFSLAGVSKKNSLGRAHGFLDKIQGNLFFDIARIIKAKKPKAFLLENVKNLISHDKGMTFKIISKTLEELGYSIHYKVLDGQHFVPQHRERIFIAGFKESIFKGKENFRFPEMPAVNHCIEDILESNPDPKYTLTDHLWDYLQKYANKHREKGNGFGFGLVHLDGITRTLSARYHKDGSEILIPQHNKNPRRLTPRECARLLGYPDNFTIPVSDTQAYRQFGNSVVSPLVRAIGKNIIKELTNINEKHSVKSYSVSSKG